MVRTRQSGPVRFGSMAAVIEIVVATSLAPTIRTKRPSRV